MSVGQSLQTHAEQPNTVSTHNALSKVLAEICKDTNNVRQNFWDLCKTCRILLSDGMMQVEQLT